MQKTLIWRNGNIKLIQISWPNLCVNAVIVGSDVVHASTRWESTIEFLDNLLKE